VGGHAVIDTQGHTGVLPPEPGATMTGRSAGWLVAAFVAVVIAAVMGLIHVPYAILKPGPVTNTLGDGDDGKPLITVEAEAKTYPTSGALDFTTVSVFGGPSNEVSVWQWIGGHLDQSNEVLPEDVLFPKGVTSTEVQKQNAAEMVDSQQEAVAVALRALGRSVPEVVTVRELTKGSPASGALRAGDILVSIDGTAVTTPDGVRAVVRAHKPGERAVFAVRRDGKQQVVSVRTAASEGHTVVGVFLKASFDFPIKVNINTGDVGGPSAGMMFSLGVYDKLTPGPMTGGTSIAGTGTINSAGAVGPIGGIRQKLAGARRGGATWFLAPAGNCDEVVGNIPEGLEVVKVATFEQARQAVQAIAVRRTGSLLRCT